MSDEMAMVVEPGVDRLDAATEIQSVERGSRRLLSPELRATNRRVLGLAVPVIGENLLETLLGIVDTLLVAGLGTGAIAGVGSGQQLMFFLLAALSGLSIGSSIVIAQAVGAQEPARAGRFARQSLLWSAIISVPLALLGVGFAHPIVGIFGMAPEVARIGAAYFQVTMGTSVVLVALIIGGGVLRGAGDARTPMLVTGFANLLNVALAYGLIFGHWGLPALGAVGSAWATFIARAAALLVLLRVLWTGRNGVTIRGGGRWWPEWQVARQILALGIPSAVEQILMASAFTVLTILVAHLGTDALAAQRIAMSVLSASYLPAIGFGVAATTLVGHSVGARRLAEARGAARVAAFWALGLMCVNAVGLLLFAGPLVRLFTSDPVVIQIGTLAVLVVGLFLPGDSIGIVLAGALRGTGDTRYPLIVSSSGMWLAVLAAWPVVTWLGGGLPGAWAPFVVIVPISSVLIWRHFHRRIRSLETA